MFAKSSFSIKCLVAIFFVLSLGGCAGQNIKDGMGKASQGNFPQALKLYNKASENDSYIALATLRIAQVYESLMQFDRAIQYYEKAQQVAKNNHASEQKDTVLSESQKGYKAAIEKKFTNLEKQFKLQMKSKQNSIYYSLRGEKFEKSGEDNRIVTYPIIEIKDEWFYVIKWTDRYDWYNLDDIEEIKYVPNDPNFYSKKDKVKAYKDFLQKYPNQGYEQRANLRLDELSFEIAENDYTIEAYEQYLQEFQDGIYAQKAKDKVEGLYFNNDVAKKDTIDAYKKYLAMYPEGKFVSTAKAKIDEMELWEKIENKEKSEDYENFLISYPNSKYRDKANAYMLYFKALKSDSFDDYENFFSKYKQGSDFTDYLRHFDPKTKLTEKLKQISLRQQSARGFIILYEETGDKEYLNAAARFVNNAKDESYFVKMFPDNFFKIRAAGQHEKDEQRDVLTNALDAYQRGASKGNIGQGLLEGIGNLYFPRSSSKIKPAFDMAVYSSAVYGTYQVRVDFVLDTEITTRTDVLGFKGERVSHESIKTYEYFTVSPKSSYDKRVEFPTIITHESASFIGLASSEHQTKISGFKGNITDVTLK